MFALKGCFLQPSSAQEGETFGTRDVVKVLGFNEYSGENGHLKEKYTGITEKMNNY